LHPSLKDESLTPTNEPLEVVVHATKYTLLALVLLCSATALAQSANVDKDKAADKENEIAILELGPAVGHALKGGGSSFGPNVAVEVTPIENWLELEGGVTRLFGRHSREWDADLLFKKPWTLSSKAEFMIGAGPEWIHTSQSGGVRNSPGAAVVLDFMFWPSGKHRFGWFLEPGYDHTFGPGHDQSVGISGGLLIAIP
jgi:hypothetical protein